MDDDVLAPIDMIEKLARHNMPIVSGLYLMRSFPHQPIIFDVAYENGMCRHHFPKNEKLVPVVSAGLGCLLIDMDVFDRLEKPYIRLGEIETDHWCDDIGFCKRVRAVGYKIYCDPSIQCEHIAAVRIKPEFVDGKWMVTYNTNGIGNVSFPAPVPEVVKEEKLKEEAKQLYSFEEQLEFISKE